MSAEPAAIIHPEDTIFITGAAGFIGCRVVANLLRRGYGNLRLFVRPSSDLGKLREVLEAAGKPGAAEIVQGNLLSRADCARAVQGSAVIYHLAAGRGEKSFSDAFMNSVVATRNLLDAVVQAGSVRRFVNISSFAVYSNTGTGGILDETSPVEDHPELRGEAYCYAKVRQEELVALYGREHSLPYVTLRPGYVYGAGNLAISNRVGIDTFGFFMHLGGSNAVPLCYVENCADAIALAGIRPGLEGQVLNVLDDQLPSSREFLRLYKSRVRRFRSLSLPPAMSYLMCSLWERYSEWSKGQLPPAYNRRVWRAYWKGARYGNERLKHALGWEPPVATEQALEAYFQSCRAKLKHA